MARAKDQTGETAPAPPRRLPARTKRPAPDLSPRAWRPLPSGSVKTELRRLRQSRSLTQQQLSDILSTRPPEMGGRWSQAEIQKFETPGRNGKPVTDESRMILEDAFEVPRGTLLAMAGWIDDVSMWAATPAPGPVDGDNDPWVKQYARLVHGDPYLTPSQADQMVQVYRITRETQRANMPSGEIQRRSSRRRLE